MRIAIADSCSRKFSGDIIDHWISRGHEVKYEIGASEFLAQWADLYYCDFSDNNIHYLYKIYTGLHPEHPNWRTYHRPKFVCRAIDWDIWIGYARDQNLVDFVDQWICIAPHMEKKLRSEATYREGQLALIRPGVNLDRFKFEERKESYNISMVSGDVWQMKNVMEGLMIFAMLVKKDSGHPWQLHWRGQWADHAVYMETAVKYFLESRGLIDRVLMYSMVDNMDKWYNKSSYILTTSIKEAFSYCTAEAMAKGLKPIINNWYGSMDIWPKEYIYNTSDEAMNMFNGNIESYKYRKFIEDHYSNEKMFEKIDSLLNL